MGKGKEIVEYQDFNEKEEDLEVGGCCHSRQGACSSQLPKVDSDDNAGTSTRFNQEVACIGNSDKLLEEKRSFALDSPEDRACEVQANLSEDGPSIVRTMLHSTVTAGYWLNFPVEFSRQCMPRRDASFMLEAEDQVEYVTRYKVARRGLSAGWRTFAKEHDLKEGDALVFHLVRPHKFKVYTLRKDHFSEADGALALVSLSAQARKVADPRRKRELKTANKGLRKRRAKRVDFRFFMADMKENIPGKSARRLRSSPPQPLMELEEVPNAPMALSTSKGQENMGEK